MPEVTMPRLSDTMEEGTIGRWLKKPGDQVEKGDILLEIETDKATMELEAYDSGTLQKILVDEGETVPIGEPIAMIGEGAIEEDAPTDAGDRTEEPSSAASSDTAAAASTAESDGDRGGQTTKTATETKSTPSENGRATGDRVKASPVARRIAEEYGIDLSKVEGTGPGGRIIKENVEAFYEDNKGAAPKKADKPADGKAQQAPAEAPAPTPSAPTVGEVVPMSRMRKAIAKRMVESKPGVPHIYITLEIDMGAVMQLRKELNASEAAPVKISVNDMIIKATAKALETFPNVNSSYGVDEKGQPGLVQHDQINVGVAISIEEGLVAPPVVDANKKSLGTVSSEIKDMATRAREGKIKPNELEGATFTVSNLGMFDVVEFGMIITPPQGAAIAVGGVREVPVVRDGEIVIGQVMLASISADHRIIDGAVAAQYMQEFKRLLENPMSLLV